MANKLIEIATIYGKTFIDPEWIASISDRPHYTAGDGKIAKSELMIKGCNGPLFCLLPAEELKSRTQG